jgi:Helix-turn-helix domain
MGIHSIRTILSSDKRKCGLAECVVTRCSFIFSFTFNELATLVWVVTVFDSALQLLLAQKEEMPANVITPEDLQAFKTELLAEIEKMLSQRNTMPDRKWLKSNEVRRLLTISSGTLQNFRVNGSLPYTKIGGVMYYDYDDVNKMLEKKQTKRKK